MGVILSSKEEDAGKHNMYACVCTGTSLTGLQCTRFSQQQSSTDLHTVSRITWASHINAGAKIQNVFAGTVI